MFHWDKWSNPSFSELLFQSNLQSLEVVTKFGFHYLMLRKVTVAEGMETSPNVLSRSKYNIFKRKKKKKQPLLIIVAISFLS